MNFVKIVFTLFQIFLIFSIIDNVIVAEDIFKRAQVVKCSNKTEEKMDRLMTILLPLGTDQHVPENAAEMRKQCNLVYRNLPFILGVFKHCTNPFAKTIAKIIFFQVMKMMDSICKTGKPSRAARELMSAGKCCNIGREPLRQCNANLIDALNGIPFAPIKSRIPMTCCQTNIYQQCIFETLEETGGCTQSTVDWAEKFIQKMIGNALSLACGEYSEESDKCTKIVNQTPKPQYSKSNKRQQTFIKPMITLMESFPDLEEERLKS